MATAIVTVCHTKIVWNPSPNREHQTPALLDWIIQAVNAGKTDGTWTEVNGDGHVGPTFPVVDPVTITRPWASVADAQSWIDFLNTGVPNMIPPASAEIIMAS